MKKYNLMNDNTGMTLLELIIAVSIFAIAAVVLLQSFVTSSRVNKKSSLYLSLHSQPECNGGYQKQGFRRFVHGVQLSN